MFSTEEALEYLLYPATSRPHFADTTFVIQAGTPDDRVVTFAEYESLIDKSEQKLRQLGIKSGDHVVLNAANSVEAASVMSACWRLNAVVVPVDFRMTSSEVVNVSKRIESKVLVGFNKVASAFEEQFGELGAAGIQLFNLAEICDKNIKAEKLPREKVDIEKPAFVILTSGTTGIPKGAVHDLKSFLFNLVELGAFVDMTDKTKALLPLPLSHIFGICVFHVCMIYGAKIIFTEATPQSFFVCLAKYKANILVAVPTIYGAMLSMSPETVGLDEAQVLLSGGAPLPHSLADAFFERFKVRINNGYGSTESKPVVLNLDGPFESVGRIISKETTVDIVDKDDNVLPEGESGEIRIGGPTLMSGYLNNPEATAGVLKNGMYYTGDVGHFENGYLYVSGRTKEMIIVAGNKVFPSEVEDVLRQNPLVQEVAVVGLPHSQLGQIVKAVIVTSDKELSAQLKGTDEERKAARQQLIAQLKEFCKGNLKRELRPMDWEFFPTDRPLPKTPIGKVDKKQLITV